MPNFPDDSYFKPAIVCILICSALIAIACPASAISGSATGEDVTLEPIIVTAKTTDTDFQTGDVDTSVTPVFYHKINRNEFEGKVENLSEVIEKVTGAQVRQSGGLGSFSSVSLRGASAEQVMVYLDGILLNDAAGGGVDLSNIALADVESIEIFRGRSPLNFDQASIGGVVNIKTMRSVPGFKATVSMGYGSFNTQKYAGFINQRFEKWDYLISADYLSADNDFEFKNDNGTPANPDDDRTEKRNNAQLDQLNLLTRIGFAIAPDSRIDFINKVFSKNQGLPSWNNSEETDTGFSTNQNISTIKWTKNDVSAFHLDTSTQLGYLIKNEKYNDSKGHVGLGAQKNEYETKRLSAKTFIEHRADNNILQFTISGQDETYRSEDILNCRTNTKCQRFSLNTGLTDTVFLSHHRLQISPGLRFQLIRNESEKAVDDMGNPIELKDRNDSYIMPQMGVKYHFNPALTLKSNFSQYHRTPSFYELFGDRGIFLGNPELEPEKGLNADAGFEFRKTLDAFRIRNFSGYGLVFMSRIDDLISRTYDSRGIGKSENISKAQIYGIECNLTMEMNNFVSLTAQYTWQDAENTSAIKAFNGKQLPGKFKHSWLTKAQFNYSVASLSLTYIYEYGMYYDTANLLAAESKSEINAALSFVWEKMILTFETKNIGNDNYEDFNGYPQPGRSYFCSVKFSI